MPSGVGSISTGGLYSAPASVAAQQSVSVIATSTADASKSASATVNLAATVAAACGAPSANAFTGCYYQDRSFNVFGFTRVDPQISFNSLPSLTGPGVGPDNFSVRWQGNFTFLSGTYAFVMATDDGSRLFIDGKIIIDGFSEHPAIPVLQSVPLTAGTHLIQVDYFQLTGGASANLAWTLSGASIPVSVAVSPLSASLVGNQTQQFAATVTGAANQQVTWASTPSGLGSITQTGFYTAPGSITSQQKIVITATSVADGTKTAASVLTLNPAAATVAVTVSPASSILAAGQIQQFSATVIGSANQQVTWSIAPSGLGSISSSGIYTAPASIAIQQSVTVTATSNADSTRAANAVIALTAQAAASCGPPGTNVFTGCYYQDRSFNLLGFSRLDPQIYFNWGSSVLGPGVGPDNFSVRWQGNFTFPAGNFGFTLATDDGCRLFVDGKMLIDAFSEHPATPLYQTINLAAGPHLIQVDYFQLGGNASASLIWSQN